MKSEIFNWSNFNILQYITNILQYIEYKVTSALGAKIPAVSELRIKHMCELCSKIKKGLL